MSRKLENAKKLILEGIRDGKPREAITRYSGARYTQHSTGVADGKAGFIAFFESFLQRNPVRDVQIVRAFEDGRYVFLQLYQSLNDGAAQWVTADLLDTDDQDRMVEHWDVIAPYRADGLSGHTMIDGETEVAGGDAEANKALVRSMLVDVFQNGNYQHLFRYVSSQSLIQHDPDIQDGLNAWTAYLQSLRQVGRPLTYDFVFKVVGQGNFVASYSKVLLGEREAACFDIFRLEEGLIVEHWLVREEIAPREEWGNCGKF